jgi:hypothetical protein
LHIDQYRLCMRLLSISPQRLVDWYLGMVEIRCPPRRLLEPGVVCGAMWDTRNLILSEIFFIYGKKKWICPKYFPLGNRTPSSLLQTVGFQNPDSIEQGNHRDPQMLLVWVQSSWILECLEFRTAG